MTTTTLRPRPAAVLIERSLPFTADVDAPGDGLTLVGHAAVFNQRTLIDSWEGTFTESIKPGAFTKTLRENTPVLQFDHGRHPLVGSLPLGTFDQIGEDDVGLAVRARLIDNWLVQPVRDVIAAKAVNGMSFRFRVVRDAWFDRSGKELPPVEVENLLWNPGNRGPLHRDLLEVQVPELGPVVFPAYEGTDVSVRARRAATEIRSNAAMVHAIRRSIATGIEYRETVSDKPWADFTQAGYDIDQWKKACLIDTGEGDAATKGRYKVPVREPDGTLNRNGVHAAAGGHGIGAVQGISDAIRQAAAKKLVSLYKNQLKEDPPESLVTLAGSASSELVDVARALLFDSPATGRIATQRAAQVERIRSTWATRALAPAETEMLTGLLNSVAAADAAIDPYVDALCAADTGLDLAQLILSNILGVPNPDPDPDLDDDTDLGVTLPSGIAGASQLGAGTGVTGGVVSPTGANSSNPAAPPSGHPASIRRTTPAAPSLGHPALDAPPTRAPVSNLPTSARRAAYLRQAYITRTGVGRVGHS